MQKSELELGSSMTVFIDESLISDRDGFVPNGSKPDAMMSDYGVMSNISVQIKFGSAGQAIGFTVIEGNQRLHNWRKLYKGKSNLVPCFIKAPMSHEDAEDLRKSINFILEAN